MTPKTNWAQRGKEAQAAIQTTVPAGFRVVGGRGEDYVAFYSYNIPKTQTDKSRIFAKGDTLQGLYQGAVESKNYPGTFSHKLRTAEGLVGISGCAQLNRLLTEIPNGTEVQIVYKGKETIKTGLSAGKQAHGFQVAVKQDNP